MLSLVLSYMSPDRGSNPQPWRIRTMLQPMQLPGQGNTGQHSHTSCAFLWWQLLTPSIHLLVLPLVRELDYLRWAHDGTFELGVVL